MCYLQMIPYSVALLYPKREEQVGELITLLAFFTDCLRHPAVSYQFAHS